MTNLEHRIAGKLATTYARAGKLCGLDRCDLEQTALVAMYEAWPRYQASRGAAWPTFATIRARGAIIDALRTASYGTRSQPAPAPLPLLDHAAAQLRDVGGDDQAAALDRIAVSQLLALVTNKRARFVLERIAAGDRQAEIAREMGVSESRVAQLVSGARRQLRPLLEAAAA